MILLTGATGYIGSHIWVELLNEHYSVIGIDNLSNSSIDVLGQINAITGLNPAFIEGDIKDRVLLKDIFSNYPISHVIHLAALKSPLESMTHQEKYFDCNVHGLKTVLEAMSDADCKKLIFSSSAAVYGDLAISPISESTNLCPTNYYGETKKIAEELIRSKQKEYLLFRSATLRYFNVAGNHKSRLPKVATPNESHSLFSEIEAVIKGSKKILEIFGDDWDTLDGTCIRDYLDISDLTRAHIAVIKRLDTVDESFTVNLGSGVGYSVKDVINSYNNVGGINLPTRVVCKRIGDVATSYANINKAKELIHWLPQKSLSKMCLDSLAICNAIRL